MCPPARNFCQAGPLTISQHHPIGLHRFRFPSSHLISTKSLGERTQSLGIFQARCHLKWWFSRHRSCPFPLAFVFFLLSLSNCRYVPTRILRASLFSASFFKASTAVYYNTVTRSQIISFFLSQHVPSPNGAAREGERCWNFSPQKSELSISTATFSLTCLFVRCAF